MKLSDLGNKLKIDNLIDEDKLNILYIEGYDKVGKSTVINYLKNIDGVYYYAPSWNNEKSMLKTVNKVESGYLIGLSLMDFLQYSEIAKSLKGNLIVIDRSIVSSLVYSKMYGDSNLEDTYNNYLDSINTLEDININHLLLGHRDEQSEGHFYYKSSGRDELINFRDFDQYHDGYSLFMSTINDLTLNYNYPKIYLGNSIDIVEELS